MPETGLAIYVRDDHLAWLAVNNGRVVDGSPYLVKLLRGRTAAQVEQHAASEGATVWFTATSTPPAPFDWARTATRPVRRWKRRKERHASEDYLTFGECAGGWYVHHTDLAVSFRLGTAQDAWAVVSGFLGRGLWVQTPARYDDRGKPVPDPDLPPGISE